MISKIENRRAADDLQGLFDLREVEKRAILRALKETGWNKTQAAAKLGVFPSSLYKKMKRHEISQNPPQ